MDIFNITTVNALIKQLDMLILGLTGGIATGKSTVSHYLSDNYHIPVIDADKIAREVVEPGTPCYQAVIEYFQPLVPGLTAGSSEDAPLNRAALGSYVFTHKDALGKLNSITHPAIRKRILYLIFKNYLNKEPVVILDIPLLFESGMDWLCSRTLTISCDPQHQLKRLLDRNKELSEAQAKARIDSQMQLSKKVKLSDYYIENDGDLSDLKRQVDQFVHQNLPALKVNENDGWNNIISSWWNWLQVVFPPFAIIGALHALARKGLLKSYA